MAKRAELANGHLSHTLGTCRPGAEVGCVARFLPRLEDEGVVGCDLFRRMSDQPWLCCGVPDYVWAARPPFSNVASAASKLLKAVPYALHLLPPRFRFESILTQDV